MYNFNHAINNKYISFKVRVDHLVSVETATKDLFTFSLSPCHGRKIMNINKPWSFHRSGTGIKRKQTDQGRNIECKLISIITFILVS
jgi:hypothetical protein